MPARGLSGRERRRREGGRRSGLAAGDESHAVDLLDLFNTWRRGIFRALGIAWGEHRDLPPAVVAAAGALAKYREALDAARAKAMEGR